MPPRVFLFDDILFDIKSANIFTDFKYWFLGLFPKRKIKVPEKLDVILYAEPMIFTPLYPELVSIAAFSQAFNIYKEVFSEPMNINNPKRSFCPKCGEMIKWWMNVPVISYILLGGKCHYCKTKISWRYPFNEMLSGIFCGALFYMFGMQSFSTFIFYYVLAAICIIVFYIDLDHWLILDEISITFTLLGIIGSLLVPVRYFNPASQVPGLDFDLIFSSFPPILIKLFNLGQIGPSWFKLHLDSFAQSIFGAIIAFSVFYIISVVGTKLAKREAMGGGDLKFAMLMGAFLGIQKFSLAVFISVILGVVIMLPGIIVGRKTGKDQVPFGCFLTAGTILTIFLGELIITLYLKIPLMY
jgi:leader peptidase (prepilin peptidase)/N-methyltransferase